VQIKIESLNNQLVTEIVTADVVLNSATDADGNKEREFLFFLQRIVSDY
jgi:hypothetical protein